jgi:hypothetical protein
VNPSLAPNPPKAGTAAGCEKVEVFNEKPLDLGAGVVDFLATDFFFPDAGGAEALVVDAAAAAPNAEGDEDVASNVNGCTTSCCCCPNTNAGIGGAFDAVDDDGVKRVKEGKGGTAPA